MVLNDLLLGESASHAGSTSSIRSLVAQVLADKAALLARRKHVLKKQQLQARMLQIQHETEAVDLDADIDATEQREQVLKAELAAERDMQINAPLFRGTRG